MLFSKGLTQIKQYCIRVKPNKKFQIPFKRWQIVRGDQVQIRAGNDKGKIGKVIKVFRKANSVVVQGINMRLKTFRSQNEELMKKRKACRIHVSNVGLHDSQVNQPVKIKYGYDPKTGEKMRISKKTGRVIEKPNQEMKKRQRRGKNRTKGLKDTSAELARKVTYEGEDFEQIKKQFEAFIAQKERRQKNLVFLH